MPNIKSAKKRVQLSARWSAANRANRSRIRTAIKKVRQADEAEVAQKHFRTVVTLLDRAATKRLIHPNQVARVKSRLAAYVNSLS